MDDLKDVFKFVIGGILPVRSQAMRWITHKRRALRYVGHCTTYHPTEDKSLGGDDRPHSKGYLCKWRKPKVLVGCAMHVETLKPVLFLSLTLHGDADFTLCIENTLKTARALKCLTQHDPQEWHTVQLVMKKIRKDDNQE